MKSRIEYKFARDFRKFVERMENYFNKYDEITRVRDIDLSMFTFEMIKKKKKNTGKIEISFFKKKINIRKFSFSEKATDNRWNIIS